MQFRDKDETYISINKNNIIVFRKNWSKDIYIKTTQTEGILRYTYEDTRNEDYNILSKLIESEDKQC